MPTDPSRVLQTPVTRGERKLLTCFRRVVYYIHRGVVSPPPVFTRVPPAYLVRVRSRRERNARNRSRPSSRGLLIARSVRETSFHGSYCRVLLYPIIHPSGCISRNGGPTHLGTDSSSFRSVSTIQLFQARGNRSPNELIRSVRAVR